MSDRRAPVEDSTTSEDKSSIEHILDSIVLLKRKQQKRDIKAKVSPEERIEVLKTYQQLEELKNSRKGKFLLEYQKGLRTILEEVIV